MEVTDEGNVSLVTTLLAPICPTYEYMSRTGETGHKTYRSTYFSCSRFPLCSIKDRENRPCTIAANPEDPKIKLVFVLNDKKSLEAGKDWKLEAALHSSEATFPFEPIEGKWDPSTIGKDGIALELRRPRWASGEAIPLPWAFRGTLSWKITGTGPEKTSLAGEGKYPIEFYVVSPYLPEFWKSGGIPLDLLRFPTLFNAWMSEPKQPFTPLGWSSYVASKLFYDSRMLYSSGIGQASYCGRNWEQMSMNTRIVLWMDLWLSDMYGVAQRGTTERYAVVCQDVSMLALAISSLGIPKDTTKLYLCSIPDAFFIKDTFLVGLHHSPNATEFVKLDRCNNPFFRRVESGMAQRIRCDPNDEQRTFFGSHTFVVQGTPVSENEPSFGDPVHDRITTPRVLDCCAGPHLGDENLQQYVEATVDNKTATYWTQHGTDVDSPNKAITYDIVDLESTRQALAPRPALVRSLAPKDLPTCLYKAVAELFSQSPYQVMEPLSGFIDPYSVSIISTWTVTAPSKSDTLPPQQFHVNISRYYNLTEVQQAYERRKRTIRVKKFQEEAKTVPNGLRYTTGTSGFYMFWVKCDAAPGADPETQQYYMVTITGNATGDVIALGGSSVGQKLKNRLVGLSSEAGVKKKLQIENLRVVRHEGKGFEPDDDALRVGDLFTVAVKFKDASSTWWHTATGASKWNKAVLMEAFEFDGKDDKEIRMRFQAIAAGDDTILITVYGQNLDLTYADLGVKVVAKG